MPAYRRFSAARIASVSLAALTASLDLGCAGPADRTVTEVDAERSMIRFDHPDFSAGRWQYGALRDPRSGVQTHLADFEGSASRATIVALRTGPGYVVPTRDAKQCVDDMLSPDWKLSWGNRGRASSPQGPASYQLFEVGDGLLGSVAVSQDWGTTSDDLGRKGNLACGYFCRDRRPMTAEDAEGILRQFAIRRGP